MDIFLTILAGTTVFVIGQIFLKWIIEPVQELRRLKGEILYVFANEHSVIHNANAIDENDSLKVINKLYQLGARLHACLHLIPIYSITRIIFLLPKPNKVKFAAKRLRSMANTMFSNKDDIYKRLDQYRSEVCDSLDLDDPIEYGKSK